MQCAPATPAATSPAKAPPTTYVLVHGALLGEFSWKPVQDRLTADGNVVVTLDLPAHGADATPTEKATLDGYRDAVVRVIGTKTNVVLVGHSFGGIVISLVAEAIPTQISKLVFVSALIPQDGESASALAGKDTDSMFGKFVSPTPVSLVFKPDGIQPVFCNDCAPADVELLKSKLRPEPLAPFGTPVKLTADRYGSVAKYDVLTKQDHAVSFAFQKTLQARIKFEKSVELDAGHVPFLTQPDALTKALESF